MTLLDEATPLCNDELPLAEQKICAHCAKPFTARSGSGGSQQKFCSADCRLGFHSNPSVAQRSPALNAVPTLPAVIQPAEKDAPAATPEAEPSNWYWSVPRQDEIACMATTDGEIEIEQNDRRVFVTRGNAVLLARNILYAAGFKGVLIATCVGGGYADVEDGDLPEHFED
jgi:hypothetical protein